MGAGPAFSSRAAVGTARVTGWNGARWNGANWNHGAFRHGRFVHRHGGVFFVGGGPWVGRRLRHLLAVGRDAVGTAPGLGLR
jgi:hypothetical protein